MKDEFDLDESILYSTYRGAFMTVAENKPWFQRRDQSAYCMFYMQPMELPDYPARSDLFIGSTLVPGLWDRFHANAVVNSGDFSKYGETFCYLKIDGINGLEGSCFLDRSQIETAIDTVLISEGDGCIVGSGTGLRYSYIDLAVMDVKKASPLVRKVLCEGKIPKRSWILFFDSNIKDQWIGIWDDSPPPPQ